MEKAKDKTMYEIIQEYNINAISLKMLKHMDRDAYVVVCNVMIENKTDGNVSHPVIVEKEFRSEKCVFETAKQIFSKMKSEISIATGVLSYKTRQM